MCLDNWLPCSLRRLLRESQTLTANQRVEIQSLERQLRTANLLVQKETTRSNGFQQDLTTSQNQETLLRQQILRLGLQNQTETQQAQARFDDVQQELADSLDTHGNLQRELDGSLELITNLQEDLTTARRREVQASINLARFNTVETRLQATPNALPRNRGPVTTVGRPRPRRNHSSPPSTPEQPIAGRTRARSPVPASARQHSEMHTRTAARRGSYGPPLPYNSSGVFVPDSPQA
mmetsp:Transcript_18347/g.20559  ORF Transcript_18347/g.20559 Transcript_18347/m.20559 type:complete len:236 (-) Transcript_18347:269-976(-)|eukprot:CAMPEP_0170815968 /NCGR_PEP_ID=MMETSP0733-20121128/38890_1 /TAXON_ID=186038 /ORGANISM="Fragilariopsis kerguelensis, Strain L26-C5" /LENGTH=235 /DNA_ID=CAMNT_0011174859 /DNA_START=520 /DNA_END=1227 /DNA_ORIENTATION=+